MSNGRLDKPDYRLPEQLTLFGIEEAVAEQEHLSADEIRRKSETALAALSALRVRSPDDGVERAPRWMGIYQRLRDEGWLWRVAVYIAWAAMPKKYRHPETQDELAKQCLGLNSDRAIATWRKRNPTIDETITMLQGAIIFDALPDAFDAMVSVASDADYKGHSDRKLMFEMAGVYTPSSRLTAEMVRKLNRGTVEEGDLSDDELREIAAMAETELERRSHDQDPESGA